MHINLLDQEPYKSLNGVINRLRNYHNFTGHTFVSSFSNKDDQLSQWRGYNQKGSGICIGFDTFKLKKFLAEKDFELLDCKYEEKEKIEIIKIPKK